MNESCPQCGSKWCGPIVCRFSAIAHKAHRDSQAAQRYAEPSPKRPPDDERK